MKIFNDVGFKALSVALDGLSMRQRVTSNNIANVDTPGFKAQFVKFEDQLQQALKSEEAEPGLALKTTANDHMKFHSASSARLIEVDQNQNDLRNDASNVDIDLEMTTLAETSLRYQALTQLTSNKLGLLKTIIRSR